ncbi:MAG: radical SAM protein [Chthoniobacterales bacterium]
MSSFSIDSRATLECLDCTGERQQNLHEQAERLRDAHFGKTVFIRGVVEVSNFCRENCSYCGMRRDNRTLTRYRLAVQKLIDFLLHERPHSITDINIQAGEDPIVVRETVVPLIRALHEHTSLGISVCLGTLSKQVYAELLEAGASFYVMKIETGDSSHYMQMQSPGTLTERLEAIRHLASTGWHVSSGFIAGLPRQTSAHILATMSMLQNLPLVGCSVSPFIPGSETPLEKEPEGSLELALNCLALMRIHSPQRFIPAVSAMELHSKDGYSRALRAGANLATINLTPVDVRSDYLLYRRDRCIMSEEHILTQIKRAGCKPSNIGISDHLRTDVDREN